MGRAGPGRGVCWGITCKTTLAGWAPQWERCWFFHLAAQSSFSHKLTSGSKFQFIDFFAFPSSNWLTLFSSPF